MLSIRWMASIHSINNVLESPPFHISSKKAVHRGTERKQKKLRTSPIIVMDHRSAPYPMSAIPNDEQQIDAVVQYPPIPETIELLNIPFRRTNEDADDDNLSLYLGTEHVSLLSQNLIPSHRDMSLVSCNDCATIVMDTTRQNIFPVMLHSLLSDNARQHHQASFMWLPHGRAFVITDMAQFCSTIVPLIFINTNIYTHRYEVFIGLLESYGFQQAVTRYGSPAFYHKVRDDVFGSLQGTLVSQVVSVTFYDTHPFSYLQIPT